LAVSSCVTKANWPPCSDYTAAFFVSLREIPMLIKFYLEGEIPSHLADYIITVDGTAIPRSTARKRDLTRILLEWADVNPTPQQRQMIELIRHINRNGVTSFSFKY
jgi:hypothetical protein